MTVLNFTPAINPVSEIKALQVNTGPLSGCYLVAPAGLCNWYFTNLGLIGIASRLSSADLDTYVRRYLDVYISRLTPQATINDVVFTDATYQNFTEQKPDSHDSYAATFLSLAARYVRLSRNTAWLNTHVITLKNIAYFNLATQVKPNSLTQTFQKPDPYNVGFNMDNCEVYRGLIDFAAMLRDYGYTDDANYYDQFATQASIGLTGLWDSQRAGFRSSDVDPVATTSFYPGATTQVFAQAFNVSPLRGWRDAAWSYLAKWAPDWASCAYDPYPWMIIGTVAAKRGLSNQAKAQLAKCDQIFVNNRRFVTINELGWYQRTKNILTGRPEL
jgi:hypothetical protein